MSLFNKIAHHNIKAIIIRSSDTQLFSISYRNLSIVPSIYDGKEDPAPKFFSPNVQVLLKRLTRPDYSKVFRKRTNSGLSVLRTPTYKFLTNEELESEIAKAHQNAEVLLQMPPVVKVQTPIEDILSKDPAIIGYDTAKFLFTDITFGVDNAHRLIVERDPDGILRHSDHDVRKRLNQTYFPILGRKLREPMMFTDEDKFNSLLDRQEYEFVLDRACVQYEPDEATYQRITSIAYQHIDHNRSYDLLRSTRHFGPLAFYLTWHGAADGLLLEQLQGGAVREAALLAALRHAVRSALPADAQALTEQVLSTPVQLTKQELVTEEDIQLDTKCTEYVEKYIKDHSAMKSQHELALQGFREHYNQLIELSRGLHKAHGGV